MVILVIFSVPIHPTAWWQGLQDTVAIMGSGVVGIGGHAELQVMGV